MKIVVVVFFLFILLWVFMLSFLVGGENASLISAVASLEPPESTSDLGESMAILDGLLSSLAVTLGLVAVLLQRKDLRNSIQAQHEQARMLSAQMHEQKESNLLSAYTARLQFLLSESDRLGADIDRLVLEVKRTKDPEKKKILDNCIGKRKTYREEAQKIDAIINRMMQKPKTYANACGKHQ